MMNVFEKIREKLEEYHEHCVNAYGIVGGNSQAFATKQCIEIVNQVEQGHNNGWIPCSERLPDYGVGVLLQDFYEGYEFGERELRDGMDGFADGDYWTSANNYIAWQPLPQPYKERDTDGN